MLLTSDQQLTSVQLSWPSLITKTDETFQYEVAYLARPYDSQCNNSDTLPNGYSLFGDTTNNSTVVTDLQPGTCYIFGVRVYGSISASAGEWRVITSTTLEFLGTCQ